MAFSSYPPLGFYIHLPWCEQKCSYCDFNSHKSRTVPEQDYVNALLHDLEQDLPLIWGRSIDSIFIGGGTPSLFSGAAIEQLFCGLRALLNFKPGIEITLEANPGSADIEHFRAYRETGINRLSIGVQSFNDIFLAALGRVHNADLAVQAFHAARAAGFDNINLDLMYGLPAQTVPQALADLEQAIQLAPEHLSHYQLTIEPNTRFYQQPPAQMPDDDLSWQQQSACQALLAKAGYHQYEISAYSRDQRWMCQHNRHYWQFADYIGIGAGAHGKITLMGENRVIRRVRQRQPKAYLKNAGRGGIIREKCLQTDDLVFEFMLNALRLTDGFETSLFTRNTGLSLSEILPTLNAAQAQGLIQFDTERICPSERGLRYLNDLQGMFLDHQPLGDQTFFRSN